MMRSCGVADKPSESKTLNTLKVATKFEKLRPAKIVLGGLLEMTGLLGSIGLLASIGLLGFIGFIGFIEFIGRLQSIELLGF